MEIIAAAAVVLTVVLAVVMIRWARSDARVAYRRDRGALRRLRRCRRQLHRELEGADPQLDQNRGRQLDRALTLASQALRARRRSTGLVASVLTLRQPVPVSMDTPFERTYLITAQQLIDGRAPAAATVTPIEDHRGDHPDPGALAEPA